jgi:hypothetical protein
LKDDNDHHSPLVFTTLGTLGLREDSVAAAAGFNSFDQLLFNPALPFDFERFLGSLSSVKNLADGLEHPPQRKSPASTVES